MILGRSEQQHKTGPEGKSGDLSEQEEAGGSCHVETELSEGKWEYTAQNLI